MKNSVTVCKNLDFQCFQNGLFNSEKIENQVRLIFAYTIRFIYDHGCENQSFSK